MRPFPPSIEIERTVGLAGRMMLWGGTQYLPVVENGRTLAGLVAERDVALYQARVGERAANAEAVATIMSTDPPTADPDELVADAALRMAEEDAGALPVVAHGKLIGLVTTSDLLAAQSRAGLEAEAASGAQVGDVMTPDPLTARPDDRLLDAAARMQQYQIRHLPVVDGDGRVQGMLSDRDVRSAVGDPLWALDTAEVDARLAELRVGDAMGAPPVVAEPHESCAQVARAFADTAVSAVPVTDADGRVVGVLSYVDLLRGLSARTGEPARVSGGAR